MFFTRIFLFIIVLCLSGCQTTPPQKTEIVLTQLGYYYWENNEFSDLDNAKQNFELSKAKGQCDVQKFSLQIPSPSCVQPPAPDCSIHPPGFARGFCKGMGAPRPKCDYSAVNAAKRAQKNIWSSCMTASGWVSKFSNVGYGSDTTGGVFSNPVASNENAMWYVKLSSIQSSNSSISAVVRQGCKSGADTKCSPYQGVWTFYLESKTFTVDQEPQGKILPDSSASIILKYLEKRLT
tara:strand:- start:338 stop:1045 length:708 start_codon:yes stop_codon:yes gene_type:complete